MALGDEGTFEFERMRTIAGPMRQCAHGLAEELELDDVGLLHDLGSFGSTRRAPTCGFLSFSKKFGDVAGARCRRLQCGEEPVRETQSHEQFRQGIEPDAAGELKATESGDSNTTLFRQVLLSPSQRQAMSPHGLAGFAHDVAFCGKR